MNELAYNIKKFRCFRNLSQRKLAEKLDKSINTVANWERGLSSPDINTTVDICKALDITPNELLGWEENKEYEAYMIDVMNARETVADMEKKRKELEESIRTYVNLYGKSL